MNLTTATPSFSNQATGETFVVTAPGRAEVLGNHTDYNEGLVLSIAINVETTIHGRTRPDRTLRLISEELGQTWSGNLDHLVPLREPDPTWPNYIIGVAQGLVDLGFPVGGAEFFIGSTIPIGAGLSSSAALEMAAGLAFQTANGIQVPPLELARIGQAAEHRFAGCNCGLLDQISSLMSRAAHLTFIDCRSLEVRHLPLPDDWVFVIIHSGVNHALTGGEYNERRAACESAARALGVPALRNITPGELDARRDCLNPADYRRARHPVGETARVAQAVSVLASGNVGALGRLMIESHYSSRDYFENSCAELDFLVDEAVKESDCAGARLSGGGFGGSTINLVAAHRAAAFTARMAAAYENKFGRVPVILTTPACDGAHRCR